MVPYVNSTKLEEDGSKFTNDDYTRLSINMWKDNALREEILSLALKDSRKTILEEEAAQEDWDSADDLRGESS